MADDEPLLVKRITSELGNVTPVIVVPGRWSDSDLELQAANVATQLVYNGGFNCVTSRVIVTWAAWPQREAFLAALRKTLAAIAPRQAYYPGAEERYGAFLAKHPEGELFGARGSGRLPWAFIPDLDPAKDGDICFTTEAFCGVMGETPIAAPTVPEFVDKAVSFVNEKVWGTLAAGLIVHPRSLRDPEIAAAVERAVADLRYGTVSLNQWSAAGYAFAVTPWGAFAGSDLFDVQSGVGVVHNTVMFSRVQKTVFRGPFRAWPTPPWFVTCRTAHLVGQRITGFEVRPSIWKLLGVMVAAVRG